MIIGIDASRANKEKKTGTEWYSYFLIQELKKIDQKNNYLLYTNSPLKNGLEECPNNFSEKLLSWPPLRLWTQIRLSYEMSKRPTDLLFVPAHALPLIHPKKSIVTIHDIGYERFPKLYRKIDIWYHRFVVKFAAKYASKIITISEFSKKEICDFYKIPKEKVKVIYNGFDKRDYKVISDKTAISKELQKYKINQPYLFFIGRLEEKKNINNLLLAFEKFLYHKPNYQLVLVGRPGFGYEKFLKTIAEKKLESKVIMLGWLEQKEIPLLLSGAEIFVFPSLYEGFGIPVLEAMASGVPVCCSNAASLPEVAGDSALLFDPHSVDDIYGKLLYLSNNKLLQFNLKQKGLERVKFFSWEKCAKETLEVFENENPKALNQKNK